MAGSVIVTPTTPLPSSAHPLATKSNGQHYTQSIAAPVGSDPLSPTAEDEGEPAKLANGASSNRIAPSYLQESGDKATNPEKQNRKSGWIELDTAARHQDRPKMSSSSKQDRARQEAEEWGTTGNRKHQSAIGYPYSPNGEEPDGEAKAIEENLERWAAAEKQRRRALRASRSTSLVGPASNSPTTSLARRISTLGRKTSTTTGGVTVNGLNGISTSESPISGGAALLRRGSKSESMSSAEDGRESGDSSQRSLRAVNSNTSAGSAKRQLGDSIVEESEADSLQGSSTPSSSATTEAKGKWKASESDGGWSVPPSAAEQRRLASDNYDSAAAAAAATANASPTTPSGNPFGDESEAAAARDSPNKARSPSRRRNSATDQSPGRSYSQSGKATPRRPIVTPGRAPSVRYHAEKSGKYAPAIVATDMDVAGREAGNPFIGKEEVEDASRSRYAMRGSGAYSSTINRPARQASASGLMEDLVEEPSTPTSAAPSAAQDPERRTSQLAPPRTSTSTSRFNEVGLDEDDAWSPTMEEPSADAGRNAQPRADPIENEGRRKPWWTELLCGCGLAPGADDEQTGKTGPE